MTDENTRTRLMTAATKLFAERGLDGVSIRELAEAANVNVAMVSYYFRGKEELYKTAVHEFGLLVQQKTKNITGPLQNSDFDRQTFETQMKLFCSSLVEHVFTHHQMFRLMQREILSGLPHCRPTFEQVFTEVRNELIAALTMAQNKGFLKRELHIGLFFFFMIHSIQQLALAAECDPLLLQILPDPRKAHQVFADQIYETFIKGALT